MTDKCSPGRFSQRISIGVARFVSPIFWYRSFKVSALRPCHGRLPRRKYKNIWPRASRSSRRLCSVKEKYSNDVEQHLHQLCQWKKISTNNGCKIELKTAGKWHLQQLEVSNIMHPKATIQDITNLIKHWPFRYGYKSLINHALLVQNTQDSRWTGAHSQMDNMPNHTTVNQCGDYSVIFTILPLIEKQEHSGKVMNLFMYHAFIDNICITIPIRMTTVTTVKTVH